MAPQHLKRPRPKRCGRPAYCHAWPRTGNPYAKLTSVSHFGKDSRMPPLASPEYDTISTTVNKAATIAKSALLIPAEMPSLKGSRHELPELRKRICRRREILRILRRAVGFWGKRTRRPRSPRSRIALQCPRAVDAHRHQRGTAERAPGPRANTIGLCALRAARAALRHPKRLCRNQCQYAAGLLRPARPPRNKTLTRTHTKHRMASLPIKAHTMARFTPCPIPIAHCASLTSSCALFRPSPAPF